MSIKRYIEKKSKEILKATKLYKLFSPCYSGIGTIITLHRVLDNVENNFRINQNKSLEISSKLLEQSIKYFLDNNYAILSINDVYEILVNKKKLNMKFVCFTFDDGYIDIFRVVNPIFKKYQLPFTVYVTTDFPDHKAVIWWYALEDLLKNKQQLVFTWEKREYKFSLSSNSEKKRAYDSMHSLLINCPGEKINDLYKILFVDNNFDVYNYSKDLSLEWGMIKEMADDGFVTIGAHSITHRNFRLLNKEEIVNESVGSKEKIEDMIKKPVEHFSFPYGGRGAVGNREVEIIKGLGFKTAVTTRNANLFYEHTEHLYSLPRVEIDGLTYTKEKDIPYFLSGAFSAIRYKMKKIVTL